jgi:hypothetical protein
MGELRLGLGKKYRLYVALRVEVEVWITVIKFVLGVRVGARYKVWLG